eukprot:m.147681 g.147681  ORF g.147681 m.147681 type:complete len:344 (+) comp11663_c0_seq1:230-1261(+)
MTRHMPTSSLQTLAMARSMGLFYVTITALSTHSQPTAPTAVPATTTTTSTTDADTSVNNDNTINILFDRPTVHGVVQVIDYTPSGSTTTAASETHDGHEEDTPHPVRFLRCGNSIVGATWLDPDLEGQSAFLNFAIHQVIMYRKPRPRRVLQLGLGAGTVPSAMRVKGITTDVIEINPAIVTAAMLFFAYRDHPGTTHVRDAAQFLFEDVVSEGKYDAVLMDLFNGSNPKCATQTAMLSRIRDHWLTDNGILLVNMFGYHNAGKHQDNAAAFSLTIMAYNVLASVFASVRCYREVPLDMVPESPANIICLAVAGKAAPLPPSPFNVPADGVYARPPELSSFWI